MILKLIDDKVGGFKVVVNCINFGSLENIAKEFGFSLVDSLVDLQLQTACETHISSTGKQVVTVDSDCISNVNELLTTLETEPSATKVL